MSRKIVMLQRIGRISSGRLQICIRSLVGLGNFYLLPVGEMVEDNLKGVKDCFSPSQCVGEGAY